MYLVSLKLQLLVNLLQQDVYSEVNELETADGDHQFHHIVFLVTFYKEYVLHQNIQSKENHPKKCNYLTKNK